MRAISPCGGSEEEQRGTLAAAGGLQGDGSRTQNAKQDSCTLHSNFYKIRIIIIVMGSLMEAHL